MVLSEFFVIFTFESPWSVAAVLAEIPTMILKITKIFSMLSCKDFCELRVNLMGWGSGHLLITLFFSTSEI